MNKLKTFDSSYFIGKSYFEEDGVQNYLIFQPIIKYFKVNTIINVADYVLSWKSKGLSAETIKPPTTSDIISVTPTISYYYASRTTVKFIGSCLKQPKVIYNHGNMANIYIDYELGTSGSNDSDPTLKKMFIWCSYFKKMQILKIVGILVMALDLTEDQASHFLVVDLVKMC